MKGVNYPRFFNHLSRGYRHLNHVTTSKTVSLLIKTVLVGNLYGFKSTTLS